jgi:catechol 2,3-dioxygenase-like lactoylglutathione lyase family enzyme
MFRPLAACFNLAALILFVVIFSAGFAPRSLTQNKVFLVSISVKNIESTAAWYHKYLNFKLGDRKDYPQNKISIGILTKDDLSLELVQHSESVPVTKFVPAISNPAVIQGYAKVGYVVENIEQLVKRMKTDSVKFVLELRESKETGSKMCIVLDNNGNWVQLMQQKTAGSL